MIADRFLFRTNKNFDFMDFILKPCVTIVPKKEILYNSGNSGRNYKCRNYNQKCRICVVMVAILQPLIKQLQPTCLGVTA